MPSCPVRDKPVSAISLGWGVQSWALAAMSALGVLPKVDYAIHSDTKHERFETYEFARKWTPWLEKRGITVITVTSDNTFPEGKGVFIPAYTIDEKNGSQGRLLRQCTHRWKIVPIRRFLQSVRSGAPVELWIGYTLDEVERAKPSEVKYIRNAFPFLNMNEDGRKDYLDKPLHRASVQKWLEKYRLGIPVKSGCVFCPFHSGSTWKEIKTSDTNDWNDAIEVDVQLRDKRPGYKTYLTKQKRSLADAVFENEAQNDFFDSCDGFCGL